MTQEKIIRMMKEAGFYFGKDDEFTPEWERFASLVRAEALEEAAKVCDAIEEDHWNLYKGRKPYTGSEAGRADPHEQGVSMGAEECAAAIRGLK